MLNSVFFVHAVSDDKYFQIEARKRKVSLSKSIPWNNINLFITDKNMQMQRCDMQSSSSNLADQGPNMNITLVFVVEDFRCFLKASRCLRNVIEIIQWMKSKKKRIYLIYILQNFRNLAIAKPSKNYFSFKTLGGKWLSKKINLSSCGNHSHRYRS